MSSEEHSSRDRLNLDSTESPTTTCNDTIPVDLLQYDTLLEMPATIEEWDYNSIDGLDYDESVMYVQNRVEENDYIEDQHLVLVIEDDYCRVTDDRVIADGDGVRENAYTERTWTYKYLGWALWRLYSEMGENIFRTDSPPKRIGNAELVNKPDERRIWYEMIGYYGQEQGPTEYTADNKIWVIDEPSFGIRVQRYRSYLVNRDDYDESDDLLNERDYESHGWAMSRIVSEAMRPYPSDGGYYARN